MKYTSILIVIVNVFFFAGALVGGFLVGTGYQSDAIEHGCAQYDSLTGDWGWK